MAEEKKNPISDLAILIAETVGKEIICAEKDKWNAALQAKVDSIPQVDIAKHFLWKEMKNLFDEVVTLCDCPAE